MGFHRRPLPACGHCRVTAFAIRFVAGTHQRRREADQFLGVLRVQRSVSPIDHPERRRQRTEPATQTLASTGKSTQRVLKSGREPAIRDAPDEPAVSGWDVGEAAGLAATHLVLSNREGVEGDIEICCSFDRRGHQGLRPTRSARAPTCRPCPFHLQRTPSFSVVEDLGRFVCFGCFRSGKPRPSVHRGDGARQLRIRGPVARESLRRKLTGDGDDRDG